MRLIERDHIDVHFATEPPVYIWKTEEYYHVTDGNDPVENYIQQLHDQTTSPVLKKSRLSYVRPQHQRLASDVLQRNPGISNLARIE
jgi:hypothetical protein